MPRHPGLQHKMRMEEVARALTISSGEIAEAFNKIRRREDEVAELKTVVETNQVRQDRLLMLQKELLETQRLTEFGLPPTISKEKFEDIVGDIIRS